MTADANTPALLVPESCRRVEKYKPSARSTAMPQLDRHDPPLADILRRASLERAQQDRRIADIFGTHTVPKVTEETLAIYLDYLKQHLEVPCQLTGIESLGCFAWEASDIFGRRRPKEYAQHKKQQPSYR